MFITKEDYELVEPNIQQANRETLALLTKLGLGLSLVLFISTLFGFRESYKWAYLAGAMTSFIILITAARLKQTMPLVSLFYIYGIVVGGIITSDHVVFIVMLVLLPVMFIDKPINCCLSTCFYVILFIYASYANRAEAALEGDIVSAVVFGIVGVVSGIFVSQKRVSGLVTEKRLHEIRHARYKIAR